MKTPTEKIGFVGVGRMGANMARRLRDVGYPVTAVFDVDGERAKILAQELGCEAVSTPDEVAALSNTIFTVVTDDGAMQEIFSEGHPKSLLKNAEGRLFVNCATLSPHIHMEIEQRVEARGGHSLEACMASSIPQAREGTLYLMCGGTPEVFEQAKPVLTTLSAQLRLIGPAGQAAKVKALVNMVMNINTAGLAEGLGLGDALGLDLTMLREVFSQTGAASRVLETDGADMQHRDHECYFSVAHAAKDSGIAYALAESVGLTLPLAKSTLEQYQRLVKLGKGELDKSGIAELTFKDRCSRY
ncbi:NAD(P)-dependent oxidoreductase [Candidatus Nitrospira allomarina]|uniref:NAD(P)-dependent oxidoreductase n=1 Tax=Candidatus Nitrospira allomarina TaxID=3020900 RepID=A0AA96GGA8_9BACT|nr:NAD(P)-dependent oxidoreductase [Candidatus Nitrospira allomarina]WNM58024.1 NAD(P)-dependent oxidoreductase [Candidatus Nitrospira allomarina]